jgi:hypothetical protein
MSSTISNLYASKIFAEHPLALWALDDNLPYISLLEEQYKDIENTWVFSGSGQFASQSLSIYWVIGTENSQNPLSGSVLAYCVYNRVLSDSEILKNYAHFKARF